MSDDQNDQSKKPDRVDPEAETVVPGNAQPPVKMAVPKIDLSDLFGPPSQETQTPMLDDDKTPMPTRELSIEIPAAVEETPATPAEMQREYDVPKTPTISPIASAVESAMAQAADEGEVSSQANIMNLPDPSAAKPETPSEPVNEQEAQTQIVGAKADLSIFESATVIRPSEVSMSEVTQYLKDLKGKSLLHEERPSITPFGEAPQFERRSTRKERRGDSRRKGGRRGSDSATGELFSIARKAPPAWMIGMGVSAAVMIIFAISSYRSAPEIKVEKASIVKQVEEDETPVSQGSSVTAQLKVEFLSDLHKNIESTKAHAPAY